MTGRLPAMACSGGLCLRDVREFLDSWGGQLALWVLPGIILVAPLALGPRQLVSLGPTVVTVTVMALLFTVALPLHAYRQFQALRDGEADDGPTPAEPPPAEEPSWTFAPAAALRIRPRRGRVVELETELLRRLRLVRVSARSRRGPGAPALRAPPLLSSVEREALEQAYADLDLPPDAPLDEVRRVYRRLMRVVHPDQHRADRRNLELAEALSRELTASYSTISTILRRHGR